MIKSSIILVLTLVCPGLAFGQSTSLEHHEWEATGFGGYVFSHDFNFPTKVSGHNQESPGTVGMHYASGYSIGTRINQNLGDFYAADLEYSFSDQPLHLSNLSPDVPGIEMGHSLHTFTYNVTYSPMTRAKRFRPYVDGGSGALLFHLTGDSKTEASALGIDLRDSWELEFNLGGGFKYLAAEAFVLTFDVKDRISHVPTYGLPKATPFIDGQFRPAISVHGNMQTWQLTFGVARQWDTR